MFVGVDSEDGQFFWGSSGYIKAFLFVPGAALARVAPPSAVAWGEARAVRFRASLDIPQDDYQAPDWPLGGDYAAMRAYFDFRTSLRTSPHYLLGYPAHHTLAYDPTPGPSWLSLLNLDSDQVFDWSWHDGDRLMVFVERARLEAHDFSNLASDAG